MQLKILGCSGGIGEHLRTTSLLIDNTILIDAGTGLGDVPLAVLQGISDVFLTHCHMDHIALLPMLCDAKNIAGGKTVTVHALPQTIQALKGHVFNWQIWPDFAEIPDVGNPVLRWNALEVGEELQIGAHRIRVLDANHTVAACGYAVHRGERSFAFQGDSGSCAEFWAQLAAEDVDLLIVEAAFSDNEQDLALRSLHLAPSLLAEELAHYTGRARVLVTHAKPGEERLVEEQLKHAFAKTRPEIALLRNGDLLDV
jgi:ribonuclease BN (tRNA processing enzyme)